MNVSPKDKEILRSLAGEIAEIAALPVHAEKAELWAKLNELRPERPMVWINEEPWNQLAQNCDELSVQCEDPFWRGVETQFRQTLYRWRHYPVDMIVEDVFYSPIVLHDTGFGMREESEKLYIEPGAVASRHFEPQIKDEKDVEKIKTPEVTADWERTEEIYEAAVKIFGDILRVEKRGVPGTWFAPWDQLITWWGVQEAMMDLVLRPELVHLAMDRLVSAWLSRLDQWEALNVLALNNGNLRIGSGGLGYTSELPGENYAPSHVRAHNLWGCATAQIFSEVSPEMHEEFALRYERRWLERFGLTYYGCCEPLHRKMSILKSVRNLRKVSMSPWVDIEEAAEAVGRDYVFSFKPNPAILAEDDFSADRARDYLRDALEKTRGCAVEIILKDISTVRNDPPRLWEWARIAMEVVEEFVAS